MGRPEKTINWKEVIKRMEAGCTAKEIMGALNLDDNTFYKRFKKEFGSSFGDYSGKFYSGGDSNLKYTQYMKALSGNAQMLIYLGKVRLGQREPEMIQSLAANQQQIDQSHLIMQLQHEIEELKRKNGMDKSY